MSLKQMHRKNNYGLLTINIQASKRKLLFTLHLMLLSDSAPNVKRSLNSDWDIEMCEITELHQFKTAREGKKENADFI